MTDTTNLVPIRKAAVKFIERFGPNALTEANMRSSELRELSQFQGRVRWQLISREIEILLDNRSGRPRKK